MTVKLVVIYPRPDDIEAFETVYKRDHVPMAVAKLGSKTKIVASKIVGSPRELRKGALAGRARNIP